MESSLGEFAFELFKDYLTGVGNSSAPEARLPVIVKRDAWWKSH
jgi:hypothetical protein